MRSEMRPPLPGRRRTRDPTVRPVTSDVYNADQRLTAEVDPLGHTTAFVYSVDAYATDGYTDSTTTYTGQTLAMSRGEASFTDLPQRRGRVRPETWAIFVQSTTAAKSATGYAVSGGDGSLTLTFVGTGGARPWARLVRAGHRIAPRGDSTIQVGIAAPAFHRRPCSSSPPSTRRTPTAIW